MKKKDRDKSLQEVLDLMVADFQRQGGEETLDKEDLFEEVDKIYDDYLSRLEQENAGNFEDESEDFNDISEDELVPVDPISVILDQYNHDDIVLTDYNGHNLVFSKIAVVPYKGTVYVLLHPRNLPEKVPKFYYMIFTLGMEGAKKGRLELVEDQATIDAVKIKYREALLKEYIKDMKRRGK